MATGMRAVRPGGPRRVYSTLVVPTGRAALRNHGVSVRNNPVIGRSRILEKPCSRWFRLRAESSRVSGPPDPRRFAAGPVTVGCLR
jgi:hypothetical protein